MQVVAASDIGLARDKNQDRYLMAPERKLFMVCDGMGGHKGGEIASSLAVEVVDMTYPAAVQDPHSALRNSILVANRLIYEKGQAIPDYRDMGTTLTAAVIAGQVLYIAHIGDSSLYLLRDGQMAKLTHDHTLAQKMADEGFLGQNEVKRHPFSHILTRALGIAPEVEFDLLAERVTEGDYILLATDGLTDLVEDDEIRELICCRGMDSLDAILGIALGRGGHDNVTAVLIQV
ncbi:MAG: serine/threonine-protein phosphatase [Syntrophomonadaceae bacterium]|nr:serine/threonine-protein phosphatase [Syntrophomonadaceae bacterium]